MAQPAGQDSDGGDEEPSKDVMGSPSMDGMRRARAWMKKASRSEAEGGEEDEAEDEAAEEEGDAGEEGNKEVEALRSAPPPSSDCHSDTV